METITTWTDKKEEFVRSLEDGDFIIARNKDGLHELFFGDDDLNGANIVAELLIGNPTYSTYRLREHFNEFHPEADFDDELETSTPGVFARYQDKFGYDYDEWINEKIYTELQESLTEKGYELLLK